MGSIRQDVAQQIADDLEGARYGHRGDVVARWCKRLGCSKGAVYRAVRKAGFASGRKTRTDNGISKAGLTEDTLLLVARAKKRSARKDSSNGKRIIMDTETAMQVVERKHGIEIHASAATVNRHLRRLGLDPHGITVDVPHIPLRSLYPNQVHQVDASVCINYSFEAKGLVIDFYEKNKIERQVSVKQRVLRLVLVDHFTGAFFLLYVAAPGERRSDLLDFLHAAWEQKPDPSFPFCGIPEILYADKSSALDSPHLDDFFDSLGIKLITHEAGNPRAKGMVEGMMRLIEMKFESRLFENRPESLAQLNAWAFEWSRDYQARAVHTRYGSTRFRSWARHIGDLALRIPPALSEYRLLADRAPDTRVVSDGYIKWSGRMVFVGDFAPQGAKVSVTEDMWESSTLRIRHDGELLITQIPELNEAGFLVDAPVIGQEFKRKADPAALTRMKEAESLPDGERVPIEFPKSGRLVYRSVKPRPAAAEAPDPLVPRHAFFDFALEALGRPLTPAENNIIRRNYKTRVLRSQFPEMLALITTAAEEGRE